MASKGSTALDCTATAKKTWYGSMSSFNAFTQPSYPSRVQCNARSRYLRSASAAACVAHKAPSLSRPGPRKSLAEPESWDSGLALHCSDSRVPEEVSCAAKRGQFHCLKAAITQPTPPHEQRPLLSALGIRQSRGPPRNRSHFNRVMNGRRGHSPASSSMPGKHRLKACQLNFEAALPVAVWKEGTWS